MISFKDVPHEELLPDKLSCIEELLNYLTKLNDNIMVYVKQISINTKNGRKIYEMSNGISCSKSDAGKWFII